ncbi:MAG: HAD-IC family P-type ATPase, partial [Phormidium sp.]
SETEVLQIAAALESYSEHPIGEAICRFAAEKMTIPTVTEVQAHPGQGIKGQLNSQSIVVGNLNFVQSLIPELNPELIQQAREFQQTGKTVVWVICDNEVLGLIVIADQVRVNAVSAIASLKKLGIEHLIMLTGDNKETAESVAQAVGISEVKAELLPEDKLHLIRQLQKQYGAVAMVGDGINDAPALAQATVGIAMGAAGSDVALETADIVLMTDRLEKIATAVELGRRSQTIVKQNIIFALTFIVLLLIANFAGNITLPIGVIGHEGSTVLVTLSGLRLLRG